MSSPPKAPSPIATGKTLYLETTDTDEPQLIDSVTLDEKGRFRFRREAHSYPAFYRLRLGESFIPFAADSVTHLTLSASGKDLFSTYKIESGDEANKQIREISQLRTATDKAIEAILTQLNNGTLDRSVALARIDSLSTQLKNTLTSKYIFKDPKALPPTMPSSRATSAGRTSPSTIQAMTAPSPLSPRPTMPSTPMPPTTPLLKQAALRSIAMARARQREAHPDTTMTAAPVEVVAFPDDPPGVTRRGRCARSMLRSLRATPSSSASPPTLATGRPPSSPSCAPCSPLTPTSSSSKSPKPRRLSVEECFTRSALDLRPRPQPYRSSGLQCPEPAFLLCYPR